MLQIKKYFEKKVSLLSTSDVRYDGELYTVDPQEQSIALKHVNCMGTEGRRTGDQAIAPSDCTYEFIIFRAVNIRELYLIDSRGRKDLTQELLVPLRRRSQQQRRQNPDHIVEANQSKRRVGSNYNRAQAAYDPNAYADYASGYYNQGRSRVPKTQYPIDVYPPLPSTRRRRQPRYNAPRNVSRRYYERPNAYEQTPMDYYTAPVERYSQYPNPEHYGYSQSRRRPRYDYAAPRDNYYTRDYRGNYRQYENSRRNNYNNGQYNQQSTQSLQVNRSLRSGTGQSLADRRLYGQEIDVHDKDFDFGRAKFKDATYTVATVAGGQVVATDDVADKKDEKEKDADEATQPAAPNGSVDDSEPVDSGQANNIDAKNEELNGDESEPANTKVKPKPTPKPKAKDLDVNAVVHAALDTGGTSSVSSKKYRKENSFFDNLQTETRSNKTKRDLQTQQETDTSTFGSVAEQYRSRHLYYRRGRGRGNRRNMRNWNQPRNPPPQFQQGQGQGQGQVQNKRAYSYQRKNAQPVYNTGGQSRWVRRT